MACKSPTRAELSLRVFLDEVLRPDQLALGGIKAQKIAHRAQGVDLASRDERCGSRAGGVAQVLVRAVVFILPYDAAVGLVEAEDAFAAGDVYLAGKRTVGEFRAGGEEAVGNVHLAAGDRGPGIAAADRPAPLHRGPARGEFLHDAGLAPHAVALGAEPL